jgi:IS1 family transposase
MYRQCAKVYTDYWEAYETVININSDRSTFAKISARSKIVRLNSESSIATKIF